MAEKGNLMGSISPADGDTTIPHILITRPVHQAEKLCQYVIAMGAIPLRFPTLDIVPPEDCAPARAIFAQLMPDTLLIFTSVNAVSGAFPLLRTTFPNGLPSTLHTAAIGQATARAVAEQGVAHCLQAPPPFDSDALLGVLAEQAWPHICVVRGESGRTLLADTLRARGMTVVEAVVYRRICPPIDPGALLTYWHTHGLAAVVVTSVEGLQNLWTILGEGGTCLSEHPPDRSAARTHREKTRTHRVKMPCDRSESLGHRLLRHTPLVVVSDRIAAVAHRLGCQQVHVTTAASDAAMGATLQRVLLQRTELPPL